MTWLIHYGPRDLAGSDFVVAIVLAEHTNPENGVAYPSVKRIATMARLSERQVTRVLADLVRRDILAVAWEATNRRPTGYLFPAFRGDIRVTPSKQPGVTSEPARGDIGGAPGVTRMSPKRNGELTENVSPPAPPRGGGRRRIPDDWTLTPELRSYAIDKGIPAHLVDEFAEEFRTYWQGDGRPKANWERTFQNRVLEKGASFTVVAKNGRMTAAEMNAGGTGKLVV